MTLVHREEKRDLFPQDNNPLGPGSYSFHNTLQPSRNLVPFNSTFRRTLFSEVANKMGPGLYSTQSVFDCKQSKENFIFKSRIQRFESVDREEDNKDETSTGLTIGNNQQIPEKRLHLSKPSKIEERLSKYKTTPSIPTLKESFGYQMDQNDELILNSNPRDIMSRLDQLRDSSCKRKQPSGSTWSKSKLARQPFRPKEGSHLISLMNTQMKWESRSVKYRKQEPVDSESRKQALVQMRQRKQFAQYYQDGVSEGQDSQLPGPGHYNTQKQPHQRKPRHQSFGSDAQRFTLDKVQLGPSKQNPAKTIYINQEPKRLTSFPTAPRPDTFNNFKLPGPGSYSSKDHLQLIKGGNFLKQQRFIDEMTASSLGPGTYNCPSFRTTNFQKFSGISVQQKLQSCQMQGMKQTLMINNDRPLEKQLDQICRSKPQSLQPQDSLQNIKTQIRKAIKDGESSQEAARQPHIAPQGKLLKLKIPQKLRKQPNRPSIGPGSYNVQVAHGKSTFNISYK